MLNLQIPFCQLDESCEALRLEVRDFLKNELHGVPAPIRARTWSASDSAFSLKLGARGWIGMCWPKQYGGHERTALQRYVVLEELLAAGAPVAFHWVADRQSGPLLLRYGTPQQKQTILPKIALGQLRFCIGMSEPDSGSDLASIRTRATETQQGWCLNGTKIWTSGAHEADYMIALARTDGSPTDRHKGLSQFLIDLNAARGAGLEIRPIRNMLGECDFNEVHFNNLHLPADALLGTRGGGWEQVNSELALERSGPERFLSSIHILTEIINRTDPKDKRSAEVIGRAIAEVATLRQMSLGVASMLARGENPALLAAIVKDQGALLEQRLPQEAHDLFGSDLLHLPDESFTGVMAYLLQATPSFSLRGGTREILRGIIARGLGLR
jgi:acyl-CoA dehydrogenase